MKKFFFLSLLLLCFCLSLGASECTGVGPSLEISSSPEMFNSSYLIAGKISQVVAKFSFEAGPEEDAEIDRIIIADFTPNSDALINLRLFNGAQQVGPTLANLSSTLDGQELKTGLSIADFSNIFVVVPAGEIIEISAIADVNVYPFTYSGATHTVGLWDNILADGFQPSVVYHGMESGTEASGPELPQYGGALVTYRTLLSVSLSPSSPSGSQTTSASHRLAHFNFTADEAYDVAVSSVTISVDGTALPESGSAVYYLRDEYGTIAGANGVMVYNGAENSVILTPMNSITIAAGATKRLIVETDTTAFQTGSGGEATTFQLSLDSWNWSDGVVVGIQPFSYETVDSNELLF